MSMRNRAGLIYWAALAAAAASACAGDAPTTSPPTVVVSPAGVALAVDDTVRLRVVVLGPSGDTIIGAPLAFTSGDTAVARVDTGGLVTAVRSGAVTVGVSSGSSVASVAISVVVNGTLRVTPESAFMQQGDTLRLTWEVRDSLGAIVGPAPTNLRSLDSTVLRVSQGGSVSFAGHAGTVGVEVSSAGRRDTAVITAVVARVAHPSDGYSCCVGIGAQGRVYVMTDGWLRELDMTNAWLDGFLFYHRNISDLKMNQVLDRAFLTDPYFGWVVSVDPASGASGVDSFAVADAQSVAVAPGDTVIYVAGWDTQVHGLRVAGGERVDSFPGMGCDLTTRERMLYLAGCLTQLTSVVEYDMEARAVRRTLPMPTAGHRTLVSADGQELYVGAQGSLYFVNLLTGAVVDTITLARPHDYVTGLALQPGTGLLWVSVGRQIPTPPWHQGYLLVIAPAEPRAVRWVYVSGIPQRLAFTASGMGIVPNADSWLDLVR